LVGTLYDYMIALTVTGVIFIASVMVIPNMSYVNLLYVNQQQLRNIAQETLKAILLETGYPIDWGYIDPFDQKYLKRVGLAYSNSPTFYVLDPDKVQRLVVDNPVGYIEYEKMRDLMGLKGYGFNIKILPPFQAQLTKAHLAPSQLNFEIKVSRNDGRPVPNAIVKTVIFYTTISQGQGQGEGAEEQSNVYCITIDDTSTDATGICEINEMLTPPGQISDVIAIFEVTVANLATIFATYQSVPPDNIANINLVEDTIILTMPDNPPPPRDARWVDNALLYGTDGITFLENATHPRLNEDKLNYGSYKVWTRTFNRLRHNNPVLLIFNFWVVNLGENPARRSVLMAGPYPNWLGSRVIQYGGAHPQGGSVVKLQRDVVVSGMTYLLEFTLWKEIA